MKKKSKKHIQIINRVDEKIQNKLKGIGMLSSRGWIPEEDVKSNGWQNGTFPRIQSKNDAVF